MRLQMLRLHLETSMTGRYRTFLLPALAALSAACGAAHLPPASASSPLSPQAQEAPIPALAIRLPDDPFAAGAEPHAVGGHASHGAPVPPAIAAPAVPAAHACPMHQDAQHTDPDRGPKCDMKLVPANDKPSPQHDHGAHVH
jgi:Heavy metal binding domain